MKQHYYLISILLTFFSLNLNAQIVINEWMASNSSIISDPDFDETGDWIELYNTSNQDQDISNFFLSDDPAEPTKWQFPSETIVDANGYLLVWADGENVGLHTNFKLTKEGESINLYNAAGSIVNNLMFALQATNISNGRKEDGSLEFAFFKEPTPGAANTTEGFEGITYYQPTFSVKGGIYDVPQIVSLSSIDGIIRYTLDGSAPTDTSSIYTTPIEISERTNLRAAIFENNKIEGKTITHSYFFDSTLKERGLPIVSISTNPAHFWDEEIGLYVQDFKPEWEYPINIEFFENDGSDRAAFNELAGIRINGKDSWVLPQKMLGIYFDNDYDKNNLEYPVFLDNRSSYDNFSLRASGNDWESTLFVDALSQSLTDETMDLERMSYRPTIAFVNGQYMGIHNMRSRTDEGLIEENFGYAPDEYDLIENNGNVEQGDDLAFNQLFEIFDTDLSNTSNFQALDCILDIENFTDYIITEIWSSNGSYGHNIKLWKPKSVDTKWRFILQDFDRGFSGSTDNDIDYFTSDSSPGHYKWIREAFENMLENEEYSAYFSSKFADHLFTTFHPKQVKKSISTFHERIEKEVPYHAERWADYEDGIESLEFWEEEVGDKMIFCDRRKEAMIEDLQNHFGLEETSKLSVLTYPANGGNVEINTIEIPEMPWNGDYFQNMPLQLKANEKAGYEFEGWSIAAFETVIDKNAVWKYLDDGSNQENNWTKVNYDDTNWQYGEGEFGYNGNETTEVSYGEDSSDKHITTYFRKSFTIENIGDYSSQFRLNLLCDDGAVVYINGQEVLRYNMLVGKIGHDDLALTSIGSSMESTYFEFLVQADYLTEGENIIAVELHQYTSNSSDLGFDLKMEGLRISDQNIFTLEDSLNVSLLNDTLFLAHFNKTTDCLLPSEFTENTTLNIDCSPYLVIENSTVLEGVSLTIEPGVEIHFLENTGLLIEGNIQAQGTENQAVIFKAAEENNQWNSIIFESKTDTSRLNWVEIRDASKGEHPVYQNAAISAFNTSLELNNIKIEAVYGNPILGYYSNITLLNSQIHSEITGDLINVKYGQGRVENCTFLGNNEIDTDAIDFDEVKNGIIRHNKIYDFFGYNSDGIDLGEGSTNVLVEENFLHNCSDKGVSVGQQSSVFIKNNTFVNCSQGVAVKDLSWAEIDQNTFYNVTIPIYIYEKNIGIGGGTAFVSNSILSNSSESAIYVDEHSILNVCNSMSDTEVLEGDSNYLDDPLFSNPTQNNFNFLENSPALGIGMGENGEMTDLGTNNHDFSVAASIVLTAIDYHPIQEDAEFLQIYNASQEAIELTDYQFSEAIQFTFPVSSIAPNETIWIVKDASYFTNITDQIFVWTSGKLSNNGETIRLIDSHGIIIDQVSYLDETPWPYAADGNGAFLSLSNTNEDNHFAKNWDALTTNLIGNEEESNLRSEGEKEANLALNIFPNPVKEFLNIQSNNLIFELKLINLIGQVVLFQDVDNQSTNLNLRGLESGIYMLEINGEVVEKVLVLH